MSRYDEIKAEFLERLRKHPLNKESLDKLLQAVKIDFHTGVHHSATGLYLHKYKTIYISPDVIGEPELESYTLIHELLHAHAKLLGIDCGDELLFAEEDVIHDEAERLHKEQPWIIQYVKEHGNIELEEPKT